MFVRGCVCGSGDRALGGDVMLCIYIGDGNYGADRMVDLDIGGCDVVICLFDVHRGLCALVFFKFVNRFILLDRVQVGFL